MSQQISLEEFKTILSANDPTIICVDVRSPAEFRESHVKGVKNIPLADLPNRLQELQKYEKIYLHCKSGARSSNACQILQNAGITCACLIEGGMDAWSEDDLTIVRGKKTISIMRQVQISAGSLVVLGCLASFTLHAAWIALPIFVGSGLVFAGISNTCGMAIILAKMPWNK